MITSLDGGSRIFLGYNPMTGRSRGAKNHNAIRSPSRVNIYRFVSIEEKLKLLSNSNMDVKNMTASIVAFCAEICNKPPVRCKNLYGA